MDTAFFIGTWKRLTGDTSQELLEINDRLEVMTDKRSPAQLFIDEGDGALIPSGKGGGTTYWFAAGQPHQPLLMSIGVGLEDRPWRVWGGQRVATVGDSPGVLFEPAVKVDQFLGVWTVRVASGDVGGRDADFVRVTADETENLLDLGYSESPLGPWTVYDEMFFNPERGALESIHGYRSISFLARDESPRRVIYAMYFQVDGLLMPFENDGTGAWGAEGG